MIKITGDIHGFQDEWINRVEPAMNYGDTLIVVGDFGVGLSDEKFWPEEMFYDHISEANYTVLFVDGNHESFDKLNSYPIEEWHGGKVHFIRKNIIHLMRGEIYDIEGKKIFAFGGGASLDKSRRILIEENKGIKCWWPEEMLSEEERENAIKNLEKVNYSVDYIVTHTAPYETVRLLLSNENLGIKGDIEAERPLNNFLDYIQSEVRYERWFFGHFHADIDLWRNQELVYKKVVEIPNGYEK